MSYASSIQIVLISTWDVMTPWQIVGKQQYQVGWDIVHWNVGGDVTGHELITIFEECWRIQSVHGYALICINVLKEWSFPLEARQALAQFHRTHSAIGATAIVGISSKMAMFVDIVLQGVAMVSGHRPKTRIFPAMNDAITWLDHERILLRDRVQRSKNAPRNDP